MSAIVELAMEEVVIRILQGYEGFVVTTCTTLEGRPALMLTFNPNSKTQKCQKIVQGRTVLDVDGPRPHFLLGIMYKGVHVIAQKINKEQAVAIAAG